jgi:hypothetical protein
MDVSVLIEKVNDNGYRATALMPAALVAEAPTRAEALERIRAELGARLSGAEVIQVNVPTSAPLNPWLAIAGSWRDHPDLDDVVQNIRDYRREVDQDAGRP